MHNYSKSFVPLHRLTFRAILPILEECKAERAESVGQRDGKIILSLRSLLLKVFSLA